MSTQTISFYDDTGRITGTVQTSAAHMDQIKERSEQPFVEGDWYDKQVYVRDGRVLPQPTTPARLEGNTLVDLPTPCTIYINEVPYPCHESVAELEFDHPGTYKIRVESWPCLPWEFEYENPAP